MIKSVLTALSLFAAGSALPALAETEAWDSVKDQLYGDRTLLDGAALIAIDAPYRSPDDGRTDLAAHVVAPEGTTIDKVTLVLDENPMPVSAIFELSQPLHRFYFDVTARVNGPTPMHVLAETTDGRVFVAETFVKTSGQGACAAPPGTDPVAALATLGEMQIELAGLLPSEGLNPLDRLKGGMNRMDLDISHPSHSGMQMDQISLLFIPMRYVETVDLNLDGVGYVTMTGSISLSENPRVSLSIPRQAQSVDVTMTDTSGTVTKAHKKLAGF